MPPGMAAKSTRVNHPPAVLTGPHTWPADGRKYGIPGGHNITKQALVDKIRAVILQMPKRGSTKPLRPVLSQQGTVCFFQCCFCAISQEHARQHNSFLCAGSSLPQCPVLRASYWKCRGLAVAQGRNIAQMTKGQLLIKHLILLIMLLDHTAMRVGMPSHAPLLFAVSGSIKSSAEVRSKSASQHHCHRHIPKLGNCLSSA